MSSLNAMFRIVANSFPHYASMNEIAYFNLMQFMDVLNQIIKVLNKSFCIYTHSFVSL